MVTTIKRNVTKRFLLLIVVTIFLSCSVLSALTDSLDGYWNMNMNFNDSMNRTNGTGSTATFGTGILGNAGQYSGATYTSFLTAPRFGYTTQDFSISFWEKHNSTLSTASMIIERGDWKVDGWYIAYNPNTGEADFFTNHASFRDYAFNQNCTNIISNTTWNHWLWVKTGTNASLYINGVNCSVSITGSSGTGVLANPSNSSTRNMNFGFFDTNAAGTQGWYGWLDEIGIWRRALNYSEDKVLYNDGVGLSYPFTPPQFNISLAYPVNGTRINTFNGSVIVNSSSAVYCSINNTRFSNHTNNQINEFRNNTVIGTGIYSLFVNCSDNSSNTQNLNIYFEYDVTLPTIQNVLPLNKSIMVKNPIYLQADLIDNMALWATNITIWGSNGTLKFVDYISDISISSDQKIYNFTLNLSGITTLEDGNYTYIIDVWDAHTDSEIKADLKPTEDYTVFENKNTIALSSASCASRASTASCINTSVDIIYPKSSEFTFYKASDRVTWDIKGTENYYIISGKTSIEWLVNSHYPCHLIIDGSAWHDCSGLPKGRVTLISKNAARIDYDTPKIGEIVSVESTGILNKNTNSQWFYIDTQAPALNITYPINNSVINKSVFTYLLTVLSNESVNCTDDNTFTGPYVYNATTGLSTSDFNPLTAPNTYMINVNCTDMTGNNKIKDVTFQLTDISGTGTGTGSVTVNVNFDLLPVVIIGLWLIIFILSLKNREDIIVYGQLVLGIVAAIYILSYMPTISILFPIIILALSIGTIFG
jgi:hypothetical protein